MGLERSDGFVQENHYDGEGLRAGLKVGDEYAGFVFYNGELLSEHNEAGIAVNRHMLGYGVAASEMFGHQGYHTYHLDEQNSTAYITNYQGQMENTYAYDAFGNLRGQTGELRSRILYTGQQYDQETNQYYLRARYYNPQIGRFTEADPFRDDGLNLYTYCKNNPVIYYDPSGYDTEKCDETQEEQETDLPKVGTEDIDQVRQEWGVSDGKDTIAVGKTNIKGLEDEVFKGGSPEVRKEAGLPSLDESMPDRDIKSPYKNDAFTRHAEEGVLNEFDQAIRRTDINPDTVTGDVVIHQSNANGVCNKCTSGIKNPDKKPGIFKQASDKYPNVTFHVTSEVNPDKGARGTSSFALKNGKFIE